MCYLVMYSVKHCCFCPKTQKKKQLCNCFLGEPGGIRTHDLLIRSQFSQAAGSLDLKGFADLKISKNHFDYRLTT